MSQLILKSTTTRVDEKLDIPKEAKIIYVKYVNPTTLMIFYTISRPTLDELGKMKFPFGRC